MAGKSWKLVVAAVFLLVLLAIMRWAHGDSTYEAKCVYAYWESNITTNLAGEVVQPKVELRMGSYVDYRLVAEESLTDFLFRRTADKPLFRDYLLSCTNSPYDSASVSNAFDSVQFKISGHPAAVVELFAKAESKSLAVEVVRFTLQRYLAFVEEGDRNREGKALAQLKDAIERKRRKGEGVSDLVAKLKKAEVAVQEYRPRITVIKPPFIIPLYTKGIINE